MWVYIMNIIEALWPLNVFKDTARNKSIMSDNPESDNKIFRLAHPDRGPTSVKITNSHVVTFCQRLVNSFWKDRKNPQTFPGPQPVSLEKRDLPKLSRYPYVCSEKTNGMRFLFVATVHKGVKTIYMVDRAYRFYSIAMSFPDSEIYNTSILDGELIENKNGSWTYYIHDCIGAFGNNVSDMTWPERIEKAKEIVSARDQSESDCFFMQVKQFWTFDNISQLASSIQSESMDHDVDGIVLTPEQLPVGTGTQYSMFKWKPQAYHTFDLEICMDSPEIVTAKVLDRGKKIVFAEVKVDTEAGARFKEELEALQGFENNCVVECNYDLENETFHPEKVRGDKTHPNGLRTVEKTMLNIVENITMDDLIALV